MIWNLHLLSPFRKVIHKGSPRAEKTLKHVYDEAHDSVDKFYREEYQNSWYTWRMTPSEIRKKALQEKANLERHPVCVMGVGQLLGKISDIDSSYVLLVFRDTHFCQIN